MPKNIYSAYTDRPRIIYLKDETERESLKIRPDGGVLFITSPKHDLPFRSIIVPKENIFDLLLPTFYGLLEDLVPGSEIAEMFQKEWEHFQELETKSLDYTNAVWVYYPRKNHLVKYAPVYWHRLSLLVRNSTLQRDEALIMDWQEIRNIFESATVAIAGCSLGGNVAHAIAGDMRPGHIKIADQKSFHMSNANRIKINYEEIGRNKATVIAEQIHSIDPFANISTYTDGLWEGNLSDFIDGGQDVAEPKTTVIVEEVDDIEMKLLIREKARQSRIPVIMVSDIGSAVQLDVRRFDRDPNLSLAFQGVSDDELYKIRDEWRTDPSRDKFFNFFLTMVGKSCLKVPEFKRILLKEDEPVFGGAPQLGSTAMMAGGVASEAVARILLGYELPERMFINKHTGEVIIEGKHI